MPIDTVPALIETLRQGHLLEPEQIDEVLATFGSKAVEPRALLSELVRRGWLTPFQVNQVSQGKVADLVLGQYVLLERLGEGGMGQVFKARHQLMKRIVALKVIRPDRVQDPAALRRFRQEIQAAARLAHPNIVLAHDADAVDGKHFLTMEFVEGTDLGKLVKQQGPLPAALACEYIRQAALALQHAHEQGMVHRDIKPSNLLLARSAGSQTAGVIKLMDLGLARLRSDDTKEMTQTGAVMGTADYIAPEQAADASRADVRADIYGLGCTLYFLLAGHPPFPSGTAMEKLFAHCQSEPEPIERIRSDLPSGLLLVLRRMMAKRMEERYQTPADVARALEPMCHSEEIQAAAVARPAPAWNQVVETANGQRASTSTGGLHRMIQRPSRRRWPWVVAAAVLGLFCLVPLAWFGLRLRGKTETAATGPARPDPVLTNSLGMKLALIPAGKFPMGSPPTERLRNPDEGPTNEVTISKPFYLGVHEVTVGNFRAFIKDTSYQTDAERNGQGALRYFPEEKKFLPDRQCNWQNPGWQQDDNFPVVCVSWGDARAFCEWLTRKEQNRTYRLPTEAEWEYACRAGTATPFSFGDSLSSFQANIHGDYPHGDAPRGPNLRRATKVGSYQANAFGLYDMHGNVTEWTADYYQDRYPDKPRVDPKGPELEETKGSRVLRGGSWFDRGNLCRSTQRGRNPGTNALNVTGFRVVCTKRP